MPDTPDLLKKKSRSVHLGTVTGQEWTVGPDGKGGTVTQMSPPTKYPVSGRQVTASEGHPWKASSHFEGDDVGGPFETTRRYLAHDRWGLRPYEIDEQRYTYRAQPFPGTFYWFRGSALPASLTSEFWWPEPAPSSNYELIAKGSTAIARVKPTNSVADLSVSLAEVMREGLPQLPGRSLWKERAQIARGSGSEYLNTQFGWLPLVSEVQNVAEVIDRGDKIWKQYERDSGRLVRRRYEFPVSVSTPQVLSSGSGYYPFPTPATYHFAGAGSLTKTLHKRQRQWFSGAFTYYLPKREESSTVSNMLYAAARARKLYGLTLDPEVLWNLAPWSWAADWFLNTGDVLSNISDAASDSLLLRYGYMMEETIVSHEYTLSGVAYKSSTHPPSSLTAFCVTKTLKRVRATPYGFGLTWDSFSPRQLAILAALGVTRR